MIKFLIHIIKSSFNLACIYCIKVFGFLLAYHSFKEELFILFVIGLLIIDLSPSFSKTVWSNIEESIKMGVEK